MTGKELLAQFGIAGSVSDRAQSLIRAAGIDLNLTYGSVRAYATQHSGPLDVAVSSSRSVIGL